MNDPSKKRMIFVLIYAALGVLCMFRTMISFSRGLIGVAIIHLVLGLAMFLIAIFYKKRP